MKRREFLLWIACLIQGFTLVHLSWLLARYDHLTHEMIDRCTQRAAIIDQQRGKLSEVQKQLAEAEKDKQAVALTCSMGGYAWCAAGFPPEDLFRTTTNAFHITNATVEIFTNGNFEQPTADRHRL